MQISKRSDEETNFLSKKGVTKRRVKKEESIVCNFAVLYVILKFQIISKFHTKRRYLSLSVKTDPPLGKSIPDVK